MWHFLLDSLVFCHLYAHHKHHNAAILNSSSDKTEHVVNRIAVLDIQTLVKSIIRKISTNALSPLDTKSRREQSISHLIEYTKHII